MATIGIGQKIPIDLVEMALRAALADDCDSKYLSEIVTIAHTGKNVMQKSLNVARRLTYTNPIINVLKENKDEVENALRYSSDKGIIVTALLSTAYEFAYDTLCILGKYFHAQNQVTRQLIKTKLSDKYGMSGTLSNGLDSVIPILMDAGIIKRPGLGLYEISPISPNTEIASQIYDRAFMHWNPNCTAGEIPSTHPFYEFISK